MKKDNIIQISIYMYRKQYKQEIYIFVCFYSTFQPFLEKRK